jgi:DNA-binding FrmR family transcriptional regulator
LAEIADELSHDTDADADEIVDAALDALEKFLEDAEEAQAVSAPLAVEQTDIQARIIRQLSAIEAAKDECLAVHDQEYQRECFVRARVLEFSPLPLDEFDKLAEGLVLRPRIKPSEDALEAVKAAHAEATSKILQLHADYLSNSRTFRVLPPDQSSTT